VLALFDVTVDGVRVRVAEIVGEGGEVATGQIPFTPRAKKVLELSLREALNLGTTYIGTEHILLGLACEYGGVAARILLHFGADSEKIRDEVITTLGIDAAAVARTSKGRRFRRPRPVSMMTQACWQYRIERRERVEAHFLNDLGDQGWELVSVHPVADWVELIFKRRRMPGALRAAG
jgi:ATP-dependent Clp protease ATP-binding subunit ClpA